MKKINEKLKSVRVKLFLTLSIVIISIIVILILLNNIVLETFYLYTKQSTLKNVYIQINDYYNNPNKEINLEKELEKIAIKNNFDILISSDQDTSVYTSDENFFVTLGQMKSMVNKFNYSKDEVLEENEKFSIKKMKDTRNGINYVLLSAKLDNEYLLYIRIPITSIQESVKISNRFLYLIAGITLFIGAILGSIISRRFTDPILELNSIAKKMSNLDFSQKYKITDADDEINNLGKSINSMSDKLEKTIKQLRNTNLELEKDIEEKSKIDEMRKSFISDVSHELKTPISLIQGYSEGLLENVNTDEESKKFYAEVILDESNKMDKLVKQLLELMKLEYGKREFDNKEFNIVELEREVIRKSKVILEEKNIQIEFEENDEILVCADDFYIEQVVTNYLTNAIKHVKEVNGNKLIKISNQIKEKIVTVKVFNTGNNINEEQQAKIWNRFYKSDVSRNRNDGGTGIGLSFVKAIMNNYQKGYGIINKEDGVEFYFELDLSKE